MNRLECSADVALCAQLFISIVNRCEVEIDTVDLGKVLVRIISAQEHLAGLMEVDPQQGAPEKRQLKFHGIVTMPAGDGKERREVSISCIEGEHVGKISFSHKAWQPDLSTGLERVTV